MTRFLFTTLPTNDLGLLTRSLPVARELAGRGHEILFCSPAKAPSRLVDEAGFENFLPPHLIYDLIAADPGLRGLVGLIASRRWRRHGNPFRFLSELVRALPIKSAPETPEVWDMDHAGALMGMLNEGFVRVNCEALRDVILDREADVVVDFWNPFAAIAARAVDKPLVTVVQANAHPASDGFIWWKPRPADVPTLAPVVNEMLAGYGLPPVGTLAELCVGDLTLVVGTPEADPLPEGTDVTYVGPILWEKRGARLPGWIDDLRKNKPLIWVYSGNPRYSSSNGSLDSMVVLRACVAALAGQDARVVLTTGHHPLPGRSCLCRPTSATSLTSPGWRWQRGATF